VATILTMVQKKQEVFVEMTDEKIQECLNKLTENTKAKWGIMTPQHMIEHLEFSYRVASGEIQDFEISTPEKHIEKVKNTLYNYEKMPQHYNMPLMKKDKVEDLLHESLEVAKQNLLEARKQYIQYYKSNPEEKSFKNPVFGVLNRYEWYLQERKHLNHHFEQFGLI